MSGVPEHNHAWGYPGSGPGSDCTPSCPAYVDPLDVAKPGRVPPRECIRAARDALTRAYGISDSRQTWPFMLEALDWLRRGLEQVAADITREPAVSGPAVTYAAPAARPLACLHIPGPGADLDDPAIEPLTRCGLVMAAADLWQPVTRRDGDRVCAPCAGAVPSQEGIF